MKAVATMTAEEEARWEEEAAAGGMPWGNVLTGSSTLDWARRRAEVEELLRESPHLTYADIAERVGVSDRTVGAVARRLGVRRTGGRRRRALPGFVP